MPFYITLFLLIFKAGLFQAYASERTYSADSLTNNDTLLTVRLHEVKVVAEEIHLSGSSSLIRQEAIQHIQSYSLSDLMQLLPGGTTQNISFKNPGRFTIRSINPSTLNALGTGISIDGVRISTNSDFRQIYPLDGYSGPDTREIATDNIESVEVIRGIPSVRYGDITSGMVVVNTRKTLRPYSLSARIAPEVKSFNADKGWQAGQNGILNLNAGYTRSNTVNSNQEGVYNRISLAAAYVWKKELLTMETGLTGHIIINDNPDNLTLLPGEYIKSDNHALQFRFSGTWTPHRPMLTDLQWNTNVSWSDAHSEQNRFFSGVYSTGSNATEDTEQEGFFIPAQYWKRNQLESQPLYTSVGLRARLHKSGKEWNSNTFIGTEWNAEGNRGRGKTYEYHTPQLPAQEGYDFRDIPFMYRYSLYAEENFTIRRLNVEGGVRMSGMALRGRHFRPVAEPRVNLSFLALQRPHSTLRSLRLWAGFGILYKMPTLSYFYREPEYAHFQSYRYRDENTRHELAVMTTARMDLAGSEQLSLPRNVKTEAGISGISGALALDISVFHERLSRGFRPALTARPVAYRNYTSTTQPGVEPVYRDGEVMIDGIPVGYTADTAFRTSQAVDNCLSEQKSGVEFVVRTDYIAPLATTFVLDGAWLFTRNENNGLLPNAITQSSGNRSYPMCAFYDNSGSAKISQRLNTTLRAVTEIKALGLTTTIALQAVWMEKAYKKLRGDHSFYMKDSDGNRVNEGLDRDENATIYQAPTWYMDTEGAMHRFTTDLYNHPDYALLIKQVSSREFLRDAYAPYFLLNMRVTKEMGKHIKFVFFANNLAKMNPVRYSRANGHYKQMNPNTFFGMELQIKI